MVQEENVHKTNFSVRLEKIMSRRGLSQHALASLAHTTQSTVRGWLNNAMPRARTLDDLANALSVNVHWLKTGEGEMDRPENTAREEATAYKFVQRSPIASSSNPSELHAGCMAMLSAMKNAATPQALDFATESFQAEYEKFKAAKYNELNQIPL